MACRGPVKESGAAIAPASPLEKGQGLGSRQQSKRENRQVRESSAGSERQDAGVLVTEGPGHQDTTIVGSGLQGRSPLLPNLSLHLFQWDNCSVRSYLLPQSSLEQD
jgi:hypothetical protein